NDEAHRCPLLLPLANALPHQSASAWLTGQRPAGCMPSKKGSNISGKDDKNLTTEGLRLKLQGCVALAPRGPRRPLCHWLDGLFSRGITSASAPARRRVAAPAPAPASCRRSAGWAP